MPHLYRTSRGGIVEWRTSEALPVAASLAPRQLHSYISRGRVKRATAVSSGIINLVGTASTQSTLSSTGSLYFTFSLQGAPSITVNTVPGYSISIGSILTSSGSVQNNSSSQTTINMQTVLQAATNIHSTLSSANSVYLYLLLASVGSSTVNLSGVGATTAAKNLLGSSTVQSNSASTAIIRGVFSLNASVNIQVNTSTYATKQYYFSSSYISSLPEEIVELDTNKYYSIAYNTYYSSYYREGVEYAIVSTPDQHVIY